MESLEMKKIINNSPMLKKYFEKKEEYEKETAKKYIVDLRKVYRSTLEHVYNPLLQDYIDGSELDTLINLLQEVKKHQLNSKQKRFYKKVKEATAELYVSTYYFLEGTFEDFNAYF